MWNAVYPYLAALLPTVAVSVLFYFIIKYILEGDRRERVAQTKWEREQRERSEAPPTSDVPPGRPSGDADGDLSGGPFGDTLGTTAGAPASGEEGIQPKTPRDN